MNKEKLDYINVRRILDRLINDSRFIEYHESFTYSDIKPALLQETVESRITEGLRILVSEGILRDKSTLMGRPPSYLKSTDGGSGGNEKKGRKPNYYQIVQNPIIFKKILNVYCKEGIEVLLNSLYTNNLIKNNGIMCAFEAIKPSLERFSFKQLASNSLLTLSAAIDEYRDPSRLGDEYCSSKNGDNCDKITKEKNLFRLIAGSTTVTFWDEQRSTLSHVKGCRIEPILSDRIKILSQLDPKVAVKFYRNTIQMEIKNIFSDLAKNSFITPSLNRFMEYDIHLSPFTSDIPD